MYGFEYFVYNFGIELIGLLMVTIAGCLGLAVRKCLNKWVKAQTDMLDEETKRTIARTAAAFVEQVWKTIHGADKLRKALEVAQEMLAKKGIPFDADEMMVLIEAAVAEFNDAFRKPLDSENANASRDNTEDVGASIVDTVEEIMAT